MSTKKSGTKRMARAVAESMPPITAVPMAIWPPAPAPWAMASGSTPSTKASEVMRMGRSRMRAASSAASTTLLPRSCSSLANSTMRMAFLAESPTVVSSPTWKKTSLVSPRSSMASTAPSTPSGTTSMTETGIDQLS